MGKLKISRLDRIIRIVSETFNTMQGKGEVNEKFVDSFLTA